MTTAPPNRRSIGGETLTLLKRLAINGGVDSEIRISEGDTPASLGLSPTLIEGGLDDLEEAGYVERRRSDGKQHVTITDQGTDILRREYQDYRSMFESGRLPPLTGTLTDGSGDGQHFISLNGYQRQFRERLGYEPFPGTLNIEMDRQSVCRDEIETLDGIPIDKWETEDKTYGAATCYAVSLRAESESHDSAHILVPERTHHDSSIVEIIAPIALRDALSLETGDEVKLYVTE
ncbi:MAG: riboflavin kinase [Natrialbaceae archaeon]|jgi:riboflavin kinase